MTYSSEGPTTTGKVILAALAGLVGWQALGPRTRDGIWGFLNRLVEAAAVEAQMKQELEEAERRKSRLTLPPMIEVPPIQSFTLPRTERPSARPTAQTGFEAAIERMTEGLSSISILEPDAKWRDVVVPPAVMLIVGKRGSGKSALAYRILGLLRYKLTPYVVGVGSQARKYLPDWIGMAPDLESLPFNTIALVDEAYLPYHSRRSMAEENMAMSQILNLSRQRNQTLIFVTQEARQVDRNIASSATVIVFKEMGMLQPEFDRSELRKLVAQAKESLGNVIGDRRRWSFVYSPDADFVGPLGNQLATFWKPRLSRLFVAQDQTPTQRPAKRQTPQERVRKAKELRSQGRSLSEIANVLGVSNSTVFNYLKGYPYRGRNT